MLIIDYLPTFNFLKYFLNTYIFAIQDYAIDANIYTKFLSVVFVREQRDFKVDPKE
jgi:hypothetical protein